ncbi:MAG: riboflavin synthase [Rhodothermales bacterium]
MFTGIIEEVGRLVEIVPFGGGRKLKIQSEFAGQLKPDESVSVNGACQTVVAADAQTFEVVAIEETLRKTTFGEFQAGMSLNLERAMPMNGRLDGHFVLGHVDATGTVVSVEQEETNWLMEISFEDSYAPYIIPVGSITLDGISLTVARLSGNHLTVAIIPHTYEHTNVSTWKAGASVNLEFDMIGKYVVRWLDHSKVNS